MNYKIENDFIKYIRKELEKMERFEILEVNGKNKKLYFEEELQARYDSRKSFYKKANIYKDENGVLYLLSYNTIVSQCKNGIVEHFGKWSQTTTRHQREFAKQFGL